MVEESYTKVQVESPSTSFDVPITKNLALSVITTISGFVSGTVIVMVLGNILPVSVFGEVSYGFTFANLIQIIVSYGFPLMVVREISQQHLSPSKAFINIFVAQFILTIITSLGLGVFVTFSQLSSSTLPALLAFAAFGIIGGFNAVIPAINKGLNDFTVEAKVATITSVSLCILILAALAILPRTSLTVSWAALISNSIGFVSAILFVRSLARGEKNYYPDRKVVQYLFRTGFPFALQLILGTLYFQVDTLIVGKLLNMEAVGYYQVAVRLVTAALPVSVILTSVFLPRLARAYNPKIRSFSSSDPLRMIGVLIILGISSTIFFLISAKPIITILYGSKMLASVPILRIFALVLIFRFVASGYGLLLIASQRQAITAWTAGIATVVNVFLNFVFVPQFGIAASAWSNVLTNFLILLIYLVAYYGKSPKISIGYSN